MSLMAWIDYSAIVLFFVAAGMLIMVLARPRHQSEALAGSGIQQAAVHQEKATYVALAVLCLCIVLIAWAVNRHSSA